MVLLLRALPWPPYALVALLAGALVAVEPTVPILRASGALLAVAVALFCDDPAETITDATPTPRSVRRGLRLAAAVAAAYAGWLALRAMVPGAPTGELAEEVALLLVVALAAGLALGGAAAAPALVVTLLAAQRLSPYVSHLRELALVAGLAVIANALRDPAARRRHGAGTPSLPAPTAGGTS